MAFVGATLYTGIMKELCRGIEARTNGRSKDNGLGDAVHGAYHASNSTVDLKTT